MSTALELYNQHALEPRTTFLLCGDGATDCGQVREINEDAFSVDPRLGLAVVADGVGGGERGDIASRMAVEALVERYDERLDEESGVLPDAAQCLVEGVQAANRAIFDLFATGRTATTIVAAAFTTDGVHIVHVGDSRAFRLRGGELEQLTQDHSLLNVYLQAGVLTPAEASTFKLRNVLTRAVGHRDEVEVDHSFHLHAPGDRYLLCTDGVTDLLGAEDIARILRAFPHDDAMAADALCDAAWEAGGHDNITAVVVRAGAGR